MTHGVTHVYRRTAEQGGGNLSRSATGLYLVLRFHLLKAKRASNRASAALGMPHWQPGDDAL
jgi:hypothetical protein